MIIIAALIVGLIVLAYLAYVWWDSREQMDPVNPHPPNTIAKNQLWGVYELKHIDGTKTGYILIPDGQRHGGFNWYFYTVDTLATLRHSADDFGVTNKDKENVLMGSVHYGSLQGKQLTMQWSKGIKTHGTWSPGRITILTPEMKSLVFDKI